MTRLPIALHFEDLLNAAGVCATQIYRRHLNGRSNDHGEGEGDRTFTERMGGGTQGYLCEIAASRIHNVAWIPGGRIITRGDLGGGYCVRGTEHTNGHLLIYRKDTDEDWFMLVTGTFPNFVLLNGIIRAGECKQDQFRRNNCRTPCWWVPQDFVEKTGIDLGSPT